MNSCDVINRLVGIDGFTFIWRWKIPYTFKIIRVHYLSMLVRINNLNLIKTGDPLYGTSTTSMSFFSKKDKNQNPIQVAVPGSSSPDGNNQRSTQNGTY
jgi:hypothetical protein